MDLRAVVGKTEYASAKEESAYTLARGIGYGALSTVLISLLQFLATNGLPLLALIPAQYQNDEIVLATGILLALDKYARKKNWYSDPAPTPVPAQTP